MVDKLKSEYNIGYQDKEKPNELQPVFIENENNMQTNKELKIARNARYYERHKN